MVEITQALIKDMFKYRDDGQLIRKFKTVGPQKDIAGCVEKRGFTRVSVKNKRFRLHQLIFLYHHGYIPEEIDHIDRNPLNNRVDNLRDVSRSQNQMNATKTRQSLTSKYKGVSWHKRDNCWEAYIMCDGISHYLGRYTDENDAAEAYNYYAIEYFGEYAHLNVID